LTVGTPAYLSPEQAVGGEITPASDLYSATVVLFEMIAGRVPFEEKDPLAMLGAHVSRTPPRLAEVAPEVELPFGLEEIIQHGLMKATAERFQSATEYLTALEGLLATAPAGTAPVSIPPAVLGVAPTALFTPVPGTVELPGTPMPPPLTPAPRTPTPPVRASTADFGDQSMIMTVSPSAYMTPVPGTLPPQARPVTLGDLSEPIPRRWIKTGAYVVLAFAIIAAILVAATRGDKAGPGQLAPAMPVPVVDRDTALKAALHDLQHGKTCEDRRAAIPTLVQLRDRRAVEPLRRARYRMRGGVLGIGDDNTNKCLKDDAEAALEVLAPRRGKVKR
jgi:hypothetical protein